MKLSWISLVFIILLSPILYATSLTSEEQLQPANQGQAKYFVFEAYKHLENKLGTLGGAGLQVRGLITADWFQNPSQELRVAAIGQVKYMAKPIYDRLNFVWLGYDTTSYLPTSGTYYPWSQDSTSDNSVINLGQLNFIFQFNLDNFPDPDSDSDGLYDKWEIHYFGDLTYGPKDDVDLDGVNNEDEFSVGRDPFIADSTLIQNAIIYVDDSFGSSLLDGTASYPLNEVKGPKKSINEGMSIVANDGMVIMGAGEYAQDTIFDTGTNVTWNTSGIVTLRNSN